MSKFMRVGVVAGVIILGNMIYASWSPLASEEPCGEFCEDSSQCGGWCPACFPNPVSPPGVCVG